MAIIVEDKRNYKKYFLLGAGLGLYKAVRPSALGGNLFPHEEEGNIQSIAVCDSKGEILFLDSNRLRVIEIDGNKLSDIRDGLQTQKNVWDNRRMGYNICPGCQNEVDPSDLECPHCGLRLK